MLDETYFRMPISLTPKSTGLAPIFIKNLSYSKKKDSLSASRTSFDSNKNMFNFFLIIYLLKDMVEDFMEFNPSFNSETPLNLSNTHELNSNSAKGSINKNSIPNNVNENPSNSPILKSSKDVNSKNDLNSPNIEECASLEELEAKNINTFKKINNITLSNKNNTAKTNPSFKNKKYKKNKAQHPHNTKKG